MTKHLTETEMDALVEALEMAVLVLTALSPEDESLYGPRALTMARAALKAVQSSPAISEADASANDMSRRT